MEIFIRNIKKMLSFLKRVCYNVPKDAGERRG